MVITTVINSRIPSTDFSRGYIKKRALDSLRYYPYGSTEKILNEYLKVNYNISLVFACKLIILKSKIEKDDTNSYIITLLDGKWEKLARIITFGTGKVSGSRILRIIFNAIK